MFINKINGLQNQVFKGYQHKVNDVGEKVYEFNFPYDYTTEDCYVEFFKVKRNDRSYGGYDVISDKCIAREKLSPNGTQINIQHKTLLDPEEAFAYRIVKESKINGAKEYIADTGLKVFKDHQKNIYAFDHDAVGDRKYEYTIVPRKGTSTMVHGSGLAVYPDALPGFKLKGFEDKNVGELAPFDEKLQKEYSEIIRTFSNKYGGSIAGLMAVINYMNEVGHTTLFSNPFGNGDDISSHHYWNKNNFRISRDMGSVNDFRTLAKMLYQNNKRLLYDYTFTGEGLEGINFQYAMRWKGKETDAQNMFRMNDDVSYGVIPKNHENLRFKVINPLEIYEQTPDGKLIIKENPNYNPNKETYFQIYDNSQVTEEQKRDLTKRIRKYENIETKDELAINSHDDTIIPFAFEIDPKSHSRRLHLIKELIEKDGQKIDLDSAEGTKIIAQYNNLRLSPKIETGTVNFDANTDLIKKRHDVSAFDEKNLLAIPNEKERDAKRENMKVAVNQVTDMDVQTIKYWMNLYKESQTMYTAKTLGKTDSVEGIDELIKKGLLPERARLSANAVKNIKNYEYIAPARGIEEKDTITVKNLMSLPLESLELAENTLGVLARPYFTNRARTDEQIGLTRFELMEMENPHLTKEYADTYLKINELFINEIKDFADEVIKTVNENSAEKLLNENDEYTEYGEFVMEIIGKDIARYAFLKAIAGNNLETKIRKDGFIEYNTQKLEENTSLKGLKIKANSPKEEAALLEGVIANGIRNLTRDDIKYVATSISKVIEGTNTLSFQLAEAMVAKSGLGMGGRLDAAKDVMDNDSVREGANSMDDSVDKINWYYNHIMKAVKSVDSSVPVIAEFTDIALLYQSIYNEKSQVYGTELYNAKGKYINAADCMAKMFNESGITSEAAYSYFFTDLVKVFAYEFEAGKDTANSWAIKHKISELLRTRNIDYIRNLYTFLSNHDKPRIVHGLALEQPLFYTNFNIEYDKNGVDINRKHRETAAMILSGASNLEELPIEARLNLDNPDYFQRVSTEGIAMAKFIKHSIDKNIGAIATEEQIKQLHLALKDLANGVYLGKGEIDELQDISIESLSSLKSAFEEIIKLAEEKHALKLTEKEKEDFIKETIKLANKESFVSQFVMHGDFEGNSSDKNTALNNRMLAQSILDKDLNISASGKAKAENNPNGYENISLYTTNLIGLLRTAMVNTEKGQDKVVQSNMLAAMKDFLEKYDKKTVEASKNRKLFVNDRQALKANSFAAKDIKRAIEMTIKQIEFKTGKEFENKELIIESLYIPAITPAVKKMEILTSFLAALLGMPFINFGDEFGLTGGERKSRNLDLQNRNAIPLHLLNEHSRLGHFTRETINNTNKAIGLRKNHNADALNDGTPYELKAASGEDTGFPAYLTQKSNGDANIVVMDTSWIDPKVYYETPEQKETELDYIELIGGLSLPIGTMFMNINPDDKTKYILKIKDGVKKIVQENENKIKMNKKTAPNGILVLKKVLNSVATRGRNHNLPNTVNSQYNFVSNPYKKVESPIEGEKLSVISK